MSEFNGKDLIELGYKPEAWFKAALAEIADKRMSRSQAILHAQGVKKAWDDAQPKTISLQSGVPFKVNITAENEDEQSNMDMVIGGFEDLMRTPTIVAGAVMPDACPSEPGAIPVGGVIGAKNAIHPGMHSADICCSMFLTVIDADPKDVLDAMSKVTHFGRGGRPDARFALDEGLVARFQQNPFMANQKIVHVAKTHLGTQIIPMNMAQPILLVQGERNDDNLGFAPHGAGRNMSRSAHKRSKGEATIEEIFKQETKGLDARFHSGKIDISELPSAYKDADSVQRDMERFGLARVVDKIMPYGSIMAGELEPEPWLLAKMNKNKQQENDDGPSM